MPRLIFTIFLLFGLTVCRSTSHFGENADYGGMRRPASGGDEEHETPPSVDLRRLGQGRTVWPDERGFPRETNTEFLKKPECEEFIATATQGVGSKPLHTDQIKVIKNGKLVYEWAKEGLFTLETPHVLWSASKTITATLLAAAMEAKMKVGSPSGREFDFDTYLREFYPAEDRRVSGKPLSDADKKRYDKIQMRHFFMMSAGIQWNESYTSLLESSFLPGLYGDKHEDIVAAALGEPMEADPGHHFTYSGGNPNILLAILEKLVGKTSYKNAPKQLLFSKIGARSAFLESDAQGHFIGSSYAYMTPEDMLRFGYLLLNGGYWKGQLILPEKYVHSMVQSVSDAEKRVEGGNSTTPYAYIEEEGVWSNGSYWLNQPIQGHWETKEGEKEVYKREFPQSPHDMFFAAGHYGQIIVVMPSQDMVIARTGQDGDGYWKKINKLSSQAVACFDNYGSNNVITEKIEPEHDIDIPSEQNPTEEEKIKEYIYALINDPGKLRTKAMDDLKLVQSGVEALSSGLVEAIVAKELCSCIYVEGLGGKRPTRKDVKLAQRVLGLCRENTPVDGPKDVVNLAVDASIDPRNGDIIAMPRGQRYSPLSRRARFLGDGVGCRLLGSGNSNL